MTARQIVLASVSSLALLLEPSARAADAPAHPPSPAKRVLLLPFTAMGVDSSLVAPLPALVDAEMGKYPEYTVVSQDDLKRMSRLEGEKQQSGCAADEQCLTEIARQTSAELILTGSLGLVGSSFVLTLFLADAKGLSVAKRTTDTAKSAGDLPKLVASSVARLLGTAAPQEAFHLPAGKKLAFAVFDLKPTGLSEQIAQNLTQVLSTEVKGVEGATVISRADIASILQLGATKQTAGCDDDGCMVAIGGALGVDRLITGDAGKVGAVYVVNLRLIDVRKGLVDNRVGEAFKGDEEELLRAVRKAARDLLGLTPAQPGKMTVTSTQPAADVFVDEKPSGQAPELLAGVVPTRHALRVAAKGYFDWSGDVYVDPLETTSVWAPLTIRPQAWYQKWWVWTIAGVVIAGATTGAILGTRPTPAAAATGSIGVALPK